MASRSTADLHQPLQKLCQLHLAEANKQLAPLGCSVFITCTYRSNAEQEKLFAQGRTAPGKKVTNARAGQSKHNAVSTSGKPAALAYDVAILDNGKLNWNATSEPWQIVGKVGVSLGLEWAWNWRHFKEAPHFQLAAN